MAAEPRPAHLNDDPLLILRIEIMHLDSLLRFLLKVWLGGAEPVQVRGLSALQSLVMLGRRTGCSS